MNEFAQVQKRTLAERIARALFPANNVPALTPEEEMAAPGQGYAPGEMMSTTVIRMCFLDRLRTLCGGAIIVESRSQTDAILTKIRTRSATSVLAPWEKTDGPR